MATNKHATIRYNALDKCFSNIGRKYYIDDLVEACNQAIYEFTGSNNGIKKRQIYADITFMKSEQGFAAPIESYADGRKKYHRYSDPNFSINKKEVSPKEQQQLKQALEVLSRFQGLPSFEWVDELNARLNDQVPKVGETQQSKHISFEENPFLKGKELFTPIYNAIRNQRVLKIDYQSYKSDAPIQFIVHPYHLKQYNNRWFLFGQSESYETLTNLALDRILAIEEIDQKYKPTTIDFDNYFEDIIGVTKPNDTALEKVQLKISRSLYPYIESKPLHGSQRVINREEDTITIELDILINYELHSTLLSFGDEIEVLAPNHFREKIKEKLSKSMKIYE